MNKFTKELDIYLDTKKHKHYCCAHGEWMACCLDKDEWTRDVVLWLVEDVLKDAINKK